MGIGFYEIARFKRRHAGLHARSCQARREQQKDKKGAGAKDGGVREPECGLWDHDIGI